MKQLYRTYINKQLFYCWSTKPLTAMKYFRQQSLKLTGRFNITELSVREGDKGAYKWNKIQLTRELLQHCCGQSS